MILAQYRGLVGAGSTPQKAFNELRANADFHFRWEECHFYKIGERIQVQMRDVTETVTHKELVEVNYCNETEKSS